ncbi:MAG: hypothetical protein FWE53_05355 [Firmicutes bacterium]|nr:hypothetical protein [Bacillota bacterium]
MWEILLELFMIVLFGLSWPFSVAKSWRAKTAKGKSILFLSFIFAGYTCGIIAKIVFASSGEFFTFWLHYVLFCFYCFNLTLVATDMLLYARNKNLDKTNRETVKA